MVILKSPQEIEQIRKSNRIVAEILSTLKAEVKPGITTLYLDQLAEGLSKEKDSKPAFKGYRGFPFSICASVNNMVVHGFPSKKPLENGDILSLDFGIVHNGYFGDSAITIEIGTVSENAKKLTSVTKKALYKGIACAVVGNRLHDISYAIQNYVENEGFSIVRQFVGHGIGSSLHEEPQIPNFGKPGTGVKLKVGMTLAIEPMVNEKSYDVKILDDGWTAVTKDGGLSAHFEHSIAITENGPEILSVAPGE